MEPDSGDSLKNIEPGVLPNILKEYSSDPFCLSSSSLNQNSFKKKSINSLHKWILII